MNFLFSHNKAQAVQCEASDSDPSISFLSMESCEVDRNIGI